jgi:hypothetical protein
MPFKKRGRYYYHRGRRYTPKQVRYYYVSKGFKRKPRKRRKR